MSIDRELAQSGERYGYRFQVVEHNDDEFGIRATCLRVGKSGDNGYWVDESGVIRICVDNNSDRTDPPIP